MRKFCMRNKRKHQVNELLNFVPVKELAEITKDSGNRQIRELQIGVKDLRLNLVPATGSYLGQLLDDEKPNLLFDANFDFNIMRRTKVRSVVADIAIAVRTKDNDEKALIINVRSCVRAVTPGFIVNHDVDELLADYGLHYLSGVIRHINWTEYGIVEPVEIPTHLSELNRHDSMIYDGFKVKYQL